LLKWSERLLVQHPFSNCQHINSSMQMHAITTVWVYPASYILCKYIIIEHCSVPTLWPTACWMTLHKPHAPHILFWLATGCKTACWRDEWITCPESYIMPYVKPGHCVSTMNYSHCTKPITVNHVTSWRHQLYSLVNSLRLLPTPKGNRVDRVVSGDYQFVCLSVCSSARYFQKRRSWDHQTWHSNVPP